MICLLAGNLQEARTWASGQQLEDDEWFYPQDMDDLLTRKSFHVIVVGSAGHNVPFSYFDKIYKTAKWRGRLK